MKPALKLKQVLVTAALFLVALARMLWPLWWINPRLNHHSNVLLPLGKLTTLLFKLDIVFQNMTGRPLKPARAAWMSRLAASPAVLKFEGSGESALPEFDWRTQGAGDFHASCIAARRPVVLRGYLKTLPRFERWSMTSFLDEFGNEELTLSCPVHDGYQGRLSEIDVPGVYVHNTERLFLKYPSLLGDAGIGRINDEFGKDLIYSGVSQLFAGRKGTGTWWHCAVGFNFFLMLDGSKKWSFIDPAYSALCMPKTPGSGKSVYYLSDATRSSSMYQKRLDTLSDRDRAAVTGDAAQASIDAIQSAFDNVPRLTVTLEPGDVLVNAPWWWHEVENMSPDSIAAATRWFHMGAGRSSNDLFEQAQLLNLSATYRAIGASLGQSVFGPDGKLRPAADEIRPGEAHAINETFTARSRAADFKSFGAIGESIDEYYGRHGYDRRAFS